MTTTEELVGTFNKNKRRWEENERNEYEDVKKARHRYLSDTSDLVKGEPIFAKGRALEMPLAAKFEINSLFALSEVAGKMHLVREEASKFRVFQNFVNEERFLKSDIGVLLRLMIPSFSHRREKRVSIDYLIPIIRDIIGVDINLKDIRGRNDFAKVASLAFAKSDKIWPLMDSSLSMHEVDVFIGQLLILYENGDVIGVEALLKKITAKCTTKDFEFVVRLLVGGMASFHGLRPVLVLEAMTHHYRYYMHTIFENMNMTNDHPLFLRAFGQAVLNEWHQAV